MNYERLKSIEMKGNGSYLGMSKGCYILKDKDGNEYRYPQFENPIDEVVLRSGNSVSTGALSSLGFWGVDVLVCTSKGRPVSVLKSLDDDSHVKTRLAQYEAYIGELGFGIARQLVVSKCEGQNILLDKYGLRPYDLDKVKTRINEVDKVRLLQIEGAYTRKYFKKIMSLIPEDIRPSGRKTYRAYDGVNNIFNLGYTALKWRVHRALLKAKLEPFLGFLHSVQYKKPSLVLDFMEVYRYLIDDLVIGFSQDLTMKDFVVKDEVLSRKRKGKRVYVNDDKTRLFNDEIDSLFASKVNIPLIRHGKRQRIETLINEEALLLAKYLRKELSFWSPRLH